MPKLPKVSANAPLNGTRTAATKLTSATCGCRCGEQVSPKSTFRQGHDQRLVGKLAKQVVDGTFTNEEVEWLQLPTEIDNEDINERITHLSAAVAKTFSEALATKVSRAADNYWAKVGKESAKADVVELSNPAAAVEGPRADYYQPAPGEIELDETRASEPTMGAPVKVKIGRWTYDAHVHGMSQAGKVTAVRYINRDGKEVVRADGKFTILEG